MEYSISSTSIPAPTFILSKSKNHISQKKSMFAQLYYPLPNIPLQPNKHQAYYKPQELSVKVFSYQSYTNSNNYIDP